MDTRELIQSIIASEEDSGDKFLESMEERISDALEVRKVELASGMMGEEAEQMNEWRYREVEQQQRRIARGMSPEESERRMKEVRDREDAARIKKRAAAKAAKAAKKTNEEVEQMNEAGINISGGFDDQLKQDLKKMRNRLHSNLEKLADYQERQRIRRLKPVKITAKRVPEPEPLDYVTVTSKKMELPEQQMAPLPNGGVADTEFSKSVDAANKATEKKMQQKVDAMQKRDAENEKNRPPLRQEETRLSDAQKLALMKTKNPGSIRTAMTRYRKVRDINKLSPAHRTLVGAYLEKTGGIDKLPRNIAAKALKPTK